MLKGNLEKIKKPEKAHGIIFNANFQESIEA